MSGSTSLPEFSDKQRNRIITDIMHWKCELEMDQEFPPEEFQSFANGLRALGDADLKKFWEENVGEWLASRSDLELEAEPDKPSIVEWHDCLTAGVPGSTSTQEVDFEEWLETQFEKLINGDETGYGYVVNVSVRQQQRGVA